MRIGEHGPAFDDLHAGLAERRAIGRFEPRDLAILVGDQRRPIERGLRHGPAEAGGILEFAAEARRIDQKLFRHAAADDAGAAEAIFLGDHDARAMLGGDARGAHAARTAADDEKIDVVIGHDNFVLHIVAALLHFNAHAADDVLTRDCPPSCRQDHALVEHFRLLERSPSGRAATGRTSGFRFNSGSVKWLA